MVVWRLNDYFGSRLIRSQAIGCQKGSHFSAVCGNSLFGDSLSPVEKDFSDMFEMLAQNGEDVKTVQSLMRHANSRITLDIYTHAVSSAKRSAQSKVVEMILPSKKRPQKAGRASCVPSCVPCVLEGVAANGRREMVGTRRLELLTSTVSR